MKRMNMHRNPTATRPGPRRLLAGALVALHLVSIAPGALAASTEIEDSPIGLKVGMAPNVMLMLDNSGSMHTIAPELPYDSAVTYGGACDPANEVPGGQPDLLTARASSQKVGLIIKTSDGSPHILIQGSPIGWRWAENGANRKCFNPALLYRATLLTRETTNCTIRDNSGADVILPCETTWDDLYSVYSGSFLNWYYGAGTATGWVERKPGTRTRIEVARDVGKQIVDNASGVRLGLASYDTVTATEGAELHETVDDVTAAKKTALKAKIDALMPLTWTPLAETLSDIGRYFAEGASNSNVTMRYKSASPSTTSIDSMFGHGVTKRIRNSTGAVSIASPIQSWCQSNAVVMVTDGVPTMDQQITGPMADYDGDCSGANAANCQPTPNFDKKISGRWYDNSDSSDYIDDVALALRETDLRPDLTAPDPKKKRSNLLTYVVGFADLGVLNDPLVQAAGAAGGGGFYPAENATALTGVLQSVLDDVYARSAMGSAAAVSSPNIAGGDNISFSSRFDSGEWHGDLMAYPLSASTADEDRNNPVWTTGCADPAALVDTADATAGVRGCSAGAQLNERATPRLIATTNPALDPRMVPVGIRFRAVTDPSAGTKLTAAMQTQLNLIGTDGANVVNFLRGDRTNEGTSYRTRTGILGDIIDAEPVYVKRAIASYADPGYAAFRTSISTRQAMVYQGANDGMLHAFNANTGAELWAYVPWLTASGLKQLASKTYKHRFYVNATPLVADVDYSRADVDPTTVAAGTSNWKTMLIGGLGKGGRGYYALDVTSPVAATEADVASKVKWEFPNVGTPATDAANVGYSFGRASLVRTEKRGWVVLLPSGYNNGTDTGGNGGGYLFVLDPRDGSLIRAIPTGAGSSVTPSGLAHVSAFAEASPYSADVQYAYGGDQLGNVWRFDLRGDASSWSALKLATLVNAGGVAQPVTSPPELATVKVAGAEKRLVIVGTGQFLGDPDVNSTAVQSIYALLDDGSTISPLRSNLQSQTISTVSGTERTVTANAVNYATKKGWYIDFPLTRERMISSAQIVRGTVIFTTIVPDNSNPCVPGGSSWLHYVDFSTGGIVPGASNAGVSLGSGLASRPVAVKTATGGFQALVSVTEASKLKRTTIPTSPAATAPRRVQWREAKKQ